MLINKKNRDMLILKAIIGKYINKSSLPLYLTWLENCWGLTQTKFRPICALFQANTP